ncbi:MAG: zinc-dependent metalloprotease [Gemmatimonadetes bacterium]|nr:zinc-dependent metalloprotease [Gemmatimonadota bacterium]
MIRTLRPEKRTPRVAVLAASAPLSLLLLLTAAALPAQQQRAVPSIAEYTKGLEQRDGYFPLYWDAVRGRLLLEVPRTGEDFLYLTSLATGIGSNDLGLDRGMIQEDFIARFERVGPKLLLVLQNPSFRAETEPTEALARSVQESFPTSTVASFDIVAGEGDRALVDATAFFLRDALDLPGRLERAGQGKSRVDAERSVIHLPRTKAFPENTEVEASLTLALEAPGTEIRRHTPDARSLTIRQHHSLVKLPAPGYRPRRFDPRIGVFSVSFYDYGKPFDADLVTRLAVRHRLVKKDPSAAMSEPVEPIVYYLDPAVPEPYRSAFKEGGAWWSKVFEAAGFLTAFRVQDMPPDMDPMDARYHVIQWVHRTEAGSSIGPSFRDPRTGEIIKAAVRMDSHRSLVDYNLYAGVVPAVTAGAGAGSGTGTGAGTALDVRDEFLAADGALDWVAALDPNTGAEAFAMARRRQHAAHEIGHTLGLAHNFIAASYGRASVMDYPAPLIKLVDGRIDVSDAYRAGPGAYDTIAIRYAYTEFPAEQEAAGLEAIVQEAMSRGLKFITNPDAEPSNSYPLATWWINGSDALDELERVLEVRRVLMDRFDESALRPGEPMWRLNERFVPVYLHHRYTLDAAIKEIGGMEYRYGVRGDRLPVTQLVPAERQRRALELLLAELDAAELAVPERVLRLLAPRPFGYASDARAFATQAAPAFDQVGLARTLADMVVGGILEPRRTARVVAFHERDPGMPSLEEVMGRLVDGAWGGTPPREHAALRRAVQRAVLDALIELAADAGAAVESRAAAEWGLRRIAAALRSARPGSPQEAAHRQLAAADIERFLDRRYEGGRRTEPLRPPPGTPIGGRAPWQ